MQVEFFRHNINDIVKKSILDVLDTPYIAMGSTVRDLEANFSIYLGSSYAAAVSSCTDALYLSLKALDIGHGDEVITTPLTFVATSNAVAAVGARPVFIDVEPSTGLIDINKIEESITKNTKVIIPVHLYGQMVDMERVTELAEKYQLKIIEDCAHCIEGNYHGIRPGELGDAACFSFFATKNITSGEGGMVTTRSDQIYERIRMMRSHGQTRSADDRYKKESISWDVKLLGLNHKMTNFQAAMLLPQLKKIDELWERRREIYQIYYDVFSGFNLSMPVIKENVKSGLHLFTIWVDKMKRTTILQSLKKKGIHCTINYNPVHLLSFYCSNFGYKMGDFPNAEHIGLSTISLPFYPLLSQEEIQYVIENVRDIVKGS